MTIEQIRDLALHLGKLRIFTSSLDLDIRDLIEIQKSIKENLPSFATIFYHNNDNPNKPLSIGIEMYRVKMLFRCMNVKIEKS